MIKKLTVRITGERASGKTMLMSHIAQFLSSAGYQKIGSLVGSGQTEELIFEGLPINIAELVNRKPKTLEHNIADALDAFWNSALGALAATETQDSSSMMTVSAIVQGVSSVATALRESQSIPTEGAIAHVIKEIKAGMRNGGLPDGHVIIEQAEMHDGTDLVAQTVVITSTAKEYVRMVHTDEAY